MLVTRGCWFSGVGDRISSAISQNWRQHISPSTSVTNIDLARNISNIPVFLPKLIAFVWFVIFHLAVNDQVYLELNFEKAFYITFYNKGGSQIYFSKSKIFKNFAKGTNLQFEELMLRPHEILKKLRMFHFRQIFFFRFFVN